MPTYDYRCEACGNQFEEFQSITAKPLTKCPACSKSRLVRLIGPGAGIIFKGSGFYETDYRSESYQKAVEAEKKAATPPATADGKPPDAKAPSTEGEASPTLKAEKPVTTDSTAAKSKSSKPTAKSAATKKASSRSSRPSTK